MTSSCAFFCTHTGAPSTKNTPPSPAVSEGQQCPRISGPGYTLCCVFTEFLRSILSPMLCEAGVKLGPEACVWLVRMSSILLGCVQDAIYSSKKYGTFSNNCYIQCQKHVQEVFENLLTVLLPAISCLSITVNGRISDILMFFDVYYVIVCKRFSYNMTVKCFDWTVMWWQL